MRALTKDSAPSTPSSSPPPPVPSAEPTPTSSKTPEFEIQKDSDRAPAASLHASQILSRILRTAADWLIPSAYAEEHTLNASREAELQDTMKKVGKLVDQLTLMVAQVSALEPDPLFLGALRTLDLQIRLHSDSK